MQFFVKRIQPTIVIRIFLSIVLLSLAAGIASGQGNVNKAKMIGFGCYYSGQPSASVVRITDLLRDNKYGKIAGLLETGHAGEKFLAVVALEKLASLERYRLSEREKKRIAKIKASPNKVSVCSGCTYFDKVSLKKIFSKDNFLGADWWIEETLARND